MRLTINRRKRADWYRSSNITQFKPLNNIYNTQTGNDNTIKSYKNITVIRWIHISWIWSNSKFVSEAKLFLFSIASKHAYVSNFESFNSHRTTLRLPVPNLDEDRKITKTFLFKLLRGASKGLMKVLKAFIKPFKVPQRNVKIKI